MGAACGFNEIPVERAEALQASHGSYVSPSPAAPSGLKTTGKTRITPTSRPWRRQIGLGTAGQSPRGKIFKELLTV